MLVCDLKPADRDKIILHAADITRPLWPEGNQGSLAHGVFVQFLKDVGHKKRRSNALLDWHGTDSHWWMEGYSVARLYLWSRLQEWCFVGEGRDLAPYIETPKDDHIAMTGNKRCRLCKESKHVTEFHIARKTKDGRHDSCAVCRRRENNGYNNN